MKTLALLMFSALLSQAAPAFAHQYEIRMASLPTLQTYSLEGQGFAASNSGISGTGTAFGFSRMWSTSALKFDYSTSAYQASPPAGLTPTTIDTGFDRWLLSYDFMLPRDGVDRSMQHSGPKGLVYSVGIEDRRHIADATTPNIFMPTTSRTGVRLGLDYSKAMDEIFTWTTAFGLFVPLYLEESSAKTGYYRFSINPDLSAKIVYKVNHFIDFSVGVTVFYEQTNYTDTGTRGVSNATDTTTSIYAPIELRFQL